LYGERVVVNYNGITSHPVRFQQNDMPQTSWKENEIVALEHNLDAYAAFRLYGEATNNMDYLLAAKDILGFIESLWVAQDNGFYPGYDLGKKKVNTEDAYMDLQSWGILAVGHSVDIVNKYKFGLKRITQNFFEPAGFVRNGLAQVAGFYDWHPANAPKPNRSRTFVWSEGTLGVILAMQLVERLCGVDTSFEQYGTTYSLKMLLENMNAIQDEHGGVPYTTANTIKGDFTEQSSVAGTAWLYFANHEFNPFDPQFVKIKKRKELK